MNKILSMLFAVVFATSMLAQSGLTCEDPIPVDSNYVGAVDGPCTIWYTASTYDLPLNVHFIPEADDSEWWPEVVIDLTCTPGYYADPKIDSIIKMAEGFDITFPVELACDRVVKNGKVEWDLFVDAMYREQLAEFGVTYNVPAFVQVNFFEAGKVSLKPDTTFASCMEKAEHVVLDDSISVLKNDSSRVFMMPFTDWQEDSIQFVWTGTQPAYVYMASGQCDFLPSTASGYVWDCYVVNPGEPFKLSNKSIKDAITANDGGGLFYSKVLSASDGKLLVEKIPMKSAQGGAILLEYESPIQINPGELYCFPKTWGATQIIAETGATIKAFFAKTSEFNATDNDANLLASYPFSLVDGERELSLSTKEMSELTNRASDDYLYVRFQLAGVVTLTAYPWDASDCADKSTNIVSGKTFEVAAKSANNILRLRYDDWKGYDLSIVWDGFVRIPTYIADTCAFTLSSSNKRVVQYNNISASSTKTYTADVVDTWATRVDADGYLYVRLNPSDAGNITFTSNKPITNEPVYTTIDEVVCDGGTYTWNGTTYDATGTYTQTFVAANGADSIVTLNLTIRPANVPTTEKVSVRYDEPYTWNGATYTESGSYTVTLSDAYGCDSVVTLELTVLEKSDVKPVDNLVLNLASAFKVYSMDHLEWVAQDVTLNWGGSTPLYVFIAKSKDFALTPYNRYVIHYEEIAADGSWVLTKEQMASWAAHADADGQIYVRFLTEFEGTLRVK